MSAENTCPLCGSSHTDNHESYSDGDEIIKLPFSSQVCVSRSCGLPCRVWAQVRRHKQLIAVLLEACRETSDYLEGLDIGGRSILLHARAAIAQTEAAGFKAADAAED